jgi:hypothetical protein
VVNGGQRRIEIFIRVWGQEGLTGKQTLEGVFFKGFGV